MEVKEIRLKYRCTDVIHIYPFGDFHGGTQHCYEEGIARQVKKIADDPFAYWIDMGDSCEFITPHDPRWDGGGIAPWLHQDNIATDEVDWYCDMVSPIANKCLGKLSGNHEDAIRIHNHDNVQKNICDKLNITDLGYATFLRLVFGRGKKGLDDVHTYTMFATHGAGGAITAGAKIIRLQRLMDSFDADIVAHGHTHDILTYTKPYLSLSKKNKVVQRVKVGAMTGCWFRTYTQGVSSSYGERKNYPPVMLGCPVFTIVPCGNVLKVEG